MRQQIMNGHVAPAFRRGRILDRYLIRDIEFASLSKQKNGCCSELLGDRDDVYQFLMEAHA